MSDSLRTEIARISSEIDMMLAQESPHKAQKEIAEYVRSHQDHDTAIDLLAAKTVELRARLIAIAGSGARQ